MSASFFVKPNESFVVVIPFDISDPDAPKMVISDQIESYPEILQGIAEENLIFETMTFRRPSWGLDCFLRELSYEGGSVRERSFSQQKFDQIRLKYLLTDSSFFDEENKAEIVKEGNYQILSPTSEKYIKNLDPLILTFFLAVASSVWDFGVATKKLMTKEDYLTLRNEEDGLKKVAERKGFTKKEEAKKKPVVEKPNSATSTQG